MTNSHTSENNGFCDTISEVQLTARQQDILALLCAGHDNREIAKRMVVTVKTVENHITRLYRQLNVCSRIEAVNYVIQNPDILGGRAPDQHAAIKLSLIHI